MIIAIDFDDVLFDTRRFRIGLRDTFEKAGVDEKMFDRTYAEIKEGQNRNKVITYDFNTHVTLLARRTGIAQERMLEAVEMWLNDAGTYFFRDSLAFLHDMHLVSAQIVVVSYGTSPFQEKKIGASGIDTYVNDIVVGNIDKGAEVEKLVKKFGNPSWFIEDRVEHIESVKRQIPETNTIFLKRIEGRYHDDRTSACDFEAHNLERVGEIIRNTMV